MNKKYQQLLIISFISIIMFFLFKNNELVFAATSSAFDLWKNNLVPVMLPFFVLSEILINYNFVYYLTLIFSKITYKLFRINPSSSFILFMSMLSGFPSNAKYINNLYQNNLIDEADAKKILLFSHFSNPLFIIGTITLFVGYIKVSIVILISHYLSNFIIGIMLRNYQVTTNNKIPKPIKSKGLVNILGSSILNSVNTLLLILGTITFFLIISNILLSYLNLPPLVKGVLTGILEMSSGVKYLAYANCFLPLKGALIAAILSFGGFAIHIQTFSILDKIKVKYLNYLTIRIVHAILAFILTFFILLSINLT